MSKPMFAVALALTALASTRPAAAGDPDGAAGPVETDVFTSGREGYHTFRIPALMVTPRGVVLAFCEGRKTSRSDSGQIDTVVKRSLDGGRTWGPLAIVARDGHNTFGNPCPVVDRQGGDLLLLLTHNLGTDTQEKIMAGTAQSTRTVWLTRSADDGQSWARPVEITASVKDSAWGWYATGPGVGIQLTCGRLLIPCDHSLIPAAVSRSHVIYSDDRGATWARGGSLPEKTDECQACELADGRVLLNMRSYHGRQRRAVATSRDRGLSWSELSWDDQLIEPVCQASLLRYTLAPAEDRNRILFANPASTRREKLTLRLSYDEGATWPVGRALYAGPAAYSSLAVLPDRSIGCLYERDNSARITCARLSLEWLTEGRDKSPAGAGK